MPDIITGTSIPEAYEDVRAMHGQAENIASKVINCAIQRIGREINTEGEGKALLLFSASSWEREVPLGVECQWPGDEISIIDKDGAAVPSQTLRISSAIPGGRKRICFIVKVPALGYTTYRLLPRSIDIPQDRILSVTSHLLENDWLHVEINSQTGYLEKNLR